MIAAGVSMLFAAGDAQALGFGRSTNVSHLGQPLNFAATVRLESDESLLRADVTAEVLSGDFRVAPAAVRVSVEPARTRTSGWCASPPAMRSTNRWSP